MRAIDWEKYKEQILKLIDYKTFYVNEFDKTEVENLTPHELRVKCCFHDDHKPSLSINIEKGFYYCHGCKAKGNVFSYIMNRYGKSYSETCFILGDSLGLTRPRSTKPERPPLDNSLAGKFHHQLIDRALTIKKLIQEKCGWTDESLTKYQVGWDADSQRITIPIYDEYGTLVNIRLYKWDAKKSQDKMVSYAAKDEQGNTHLYGEARIFGIEDLYNDEKYIIWCAGEKDRIQLKQQGFNCCTVTSGEGIFRAEWVPLFKNKEVFICLDADETGRNASLSIAEKLYKVAKIRIVELPAEVGDKGDVSDYFVTLGHSPTEYQQLLDKSSRYKDDTPINDSDEEVHEVHLSEASLSKYSGKKVKIPILISGKDTAPYIIPRKIKVTCSLSRGKKCQSCGMSTSAGEVSFEFGPKQPDILQMIDCTKSTQTEIIKHHAGVIKGCDSIDIEIIDNLNIEEVRLIPQAESSQDTISDRDYAVRKSFYIGHGIKSNQRYEIVGYTFPDPRSQYVTHIFETAIPAQDSISSFEVDDNMIEQLKIFQVGPEQTIEEKLKDIHTDLERNITKIWGRFLPAVAIDLIYHTALSFYFQGQFVKKGWAELLIIGDSGQGKSTLLERIMSHYQMGEFLNGESSGRTGLVYNLQETQKRWFLSWGKIPLNDRRLLAIDEFSGISEDDIALMSDVRSSGVARVNKVITAETNARTRLIFLSNSRTGRQLNTFNNGIEAVSGLFGKNEDVRRLDFVVAVASGDVKDSTINRRIDTFAEVPHKYTTGLCKNLVMWAWSRKPENIIFGDGTEDVILAKAIQMGKNYSAKIPLVEGADQRLKIARLSIATAIRLFSMENGQDVIVKPEHVEFAVSIMTTSYNNKNLSYDIFSKQANKDEEFEDTEVKRLSVEFEKFTDANSLAELLLEYKYFRKAELQSQMDYDKDEINKLLRWLTKNRIIENTSGGFRKKPAGIQFFRYIRENPVEDFDPESADAPF